MDPLPEGNRGNSMSERFENINNGAGIEGMEDIGKDEGLRGGNDMEVKKDSMSGVSGQTVPFGMKG